MSDDPRSFEQLPDLFDRYVQLVGVPLREYLVARLPEHGQRAIDLGCGTGQYTLQLADRFIEVLAVDRSAALVQYAEAARPRGNITYQQRELSDVSSAGDGLFDLVFSAYGLHHVDRLGTTLR